MVGLVLIFFAITAVASTVADDRPAMLQGDWVPQDPHAIDYEELPRVPGEHVVVNDVRAEKGVNQHNYLAHHEGTFFLMWSDGPGVEDRVGQRVKCTTSADGLTWEEPEYLTPVPPGSGPDSPPGLEAETGALIILRNARLDFLPQKRHTLDASTHHL